MRWPRAALDVRAQREAVVFRELLVEGAQLPGKLGSGRVKAQSQGGILVDL
jgi:hypothetical protein